MTTTSDLQNMEGRTAVDKDGAKLGKIGQVYVDDQSGQPLWVTISTGLFGTKESFAPLYGSRTDGDNLQLAVTKDMVKDAPSVDPDGHIEGDDNEALYTYYEGHLGHGSQDAPVQDQSQDQGYAGDTREDRSGREGIQGRDTSGPTTDDAMTRSEERLHVGTETGRSRPGPAAQARRHRERHPDRPGQPRGSPRRAGADHRRQPRPGDLRRGHQRGRARGHAARRASRHRQGDRPGRAGPARHRDRHRGPRGQRDPPQGADRRPRHRRHRHRPLSVPR